MPSGRLQVERRSERHDINFAPILRAVTECPETIGKYQDIILLAAEVEGPGSDLTCSFR